MKKIVLGSSAFGSAVPPAESSRLLEQAFKAGISRIDTGPFYGSGFAPGLIAKAIAAGGFKVKVSTKFGSFREPAWRMLLKRAMRARSLGDLSLKLGPSYSNQARLDASWWTAEKQAANIEYALAPLRATEIEYLFTHGAPGALSEANLLAMQRKLSSLGSSKIGICSPPDDQLPKLIGQASTAVACLQIHFSQLLKAHAQLAGSGFESIWVHGVYSPAPGDSIADLAAREAFCRDAVAAIPQLKFVVGIKSDRSLERLAKFSDSLG